MTADNVGGSAASALHSIQRVAQSVRRSPLACRLQCDGFMSALDRVMTRLGFVKLASFGLLLTPEGRILSMRPAALDDGLGGRIVGWRDDDLAAMELEKWEPARPATRSAMATPPATPKRPPAPTRPFPVVTTQPAPLPPVASFPVPEPLIVPPPAAPPVMVGAAELAEEPVVDEDDWEWTIAMARARAAVDESERAAAAAAVPARRTRADTVPPPITQPRFIETKTSPSATLDGEQTLTSVTEVDPDGWPKIEVARVIHRAETPRVVLAAKPTPEAAPFPRPASSPPVTVIPIPRLPTMKSTPVTQLGPVVRSALPTPMLPSAPRRFPRGTGPQTPETVTCLAPEDTVTDFALPPAEATPLPSVKRATRG